MCVRYDILALYESPSFGGFRLSAGYSFNANDLSAAQSGFATADNTRAITSGLSYNNGPLVAFIAYEQLNASNKLSNAQTSATPLSFLFGAAYAFKVLKLIPAYDAEQAGCFPGKGLPSGPNSLGFQGTPRIASVQDLTEWKDPRYN